VIESILIERFRGIREGAMSGLSALTVLVGPNGCGKSSVLEALYVAAHPSPQRALATCIERRSLLNGARWVFFRTGEGRKTVLTVKSSEIHRACELVYGEMPSGADVIPNATGPAAAILVQLGPPARQAQGVNLFVARDNRWSTSPNVLAPVVAPAARIVDPVETAATPPLHEIYTKAVEHGLIGEVEALAKEVIPGFRDLRILTPSGESPTLYVVFANGTPVPLALAGDGIEGLLRQVSLLAAVPNELVLLEEPEAFKYPRTMRLMARAIVAATRRGIQIVLTTHSLEMIDAVVAEAEAQKFDLANLSLFRLLLTDGVLKSSRLAGSEIAFERKQIDEDLR
jgi:energy-coupling factor transporter ATP-binding protein EcfA2